MPRKTSDAPKRGRAEGEKSKFVRAQPAKMTPAQIEEKAAKHGLQISRGHIYTLRSMEKKKKREAASAKRTPKRAKPSGRGSAKRRDSAAAARSRSIPPASTSVSDERVLQALILNIGFERSRKVFDNLSTNLAPLLRASAKSSLLRTPLSRAKLHVALAS